MDLKSKVAIITGASSGLGAAISKALVRAGAIVYGIGRNAKALHELEEGLGANFIPVSLDITHLSEVQNWFRVTFHGENSPDILINNAGTGSFGKFDEMPTEEWFNMINTNLNGMYVVTREVVTLMKPGNSYGHIVNIGSILGLTTRSEGAAYSATKYAINGFSESLFKELRGDRIKVTCVNPGSIDTQFFKSSGIEAHPNMLQPEEVAATIIHLLQTPDNMLISEMTIRPLNPRAPE